MITKIKRSKGNIVKQVSMINHSTIMLLQWNMYIDVLELSHTADLYLYYDTTTLQDSVIYFHKNRTNVHST